MKMAYCGITSIGLLCIVRTQVMLHGNKSKVAYRYRHSQPNSIILKNLTMEIARETSLPTHVLDKLEGKLICSLPQYKKYGKKIKSLFLPCNPTIAC